MIYLTTIITMLFTLLGRDQNDLNLHMKLNSLIWADSTDMLVKINLTNKGKPVMIMDQIFDDIYPNEPTPLNNLSFAVEIKEGNDYVGYRDRSFVDHIITNFKTAEELLDSIKIKRPEAFLKLSNHDTLSLDYSFAFGRHYKKGLYRIQAVFVAKLTEKRWFIKSEWQYFEVTQDLYNPKPQETRESSVSIFWQKNNQ